MEPSSFTIPERYLGKKELGQGNARQGEGNASGNARLAQTHQGARTDQVEPRLRSEIRQARKGQEEGQEVDRMNWWGKVIGTGVGMLGGPIGALAGAALGHLYDEDDPTPKNEQKARILYLAYFFLRCESGEGGRGNFSG